MSSQEQSTELFTITTTAKPDMPEKIASKPVHDSGNEIPATQPQSVADQPAVINVNGNTPTRTPLGADNGGFVEYDETSMMEETPPPLSYVDFVPKFLENAPSKEEAPKYAPFCTLVEKANQWLIDHQDFTVWKCETIYYKLQADDTFSTEACLFTESAFGINKFVTCLRMWLLPRLTDAIPLAQIGYTTALPGWQFTVREPSEFDAFDPNIPESTRSGASFGVKCVENNDNQTLSTPQTDNSQTGKPGKHDISNMETKQESNSDAKTLDTKQENNKDSIESPECKLETTEPSASDVTKETPKNVGGLEKETEMKKQTEAANVRKAVMKPAMPSSKVEVSLSTSFTECIRNMNRQISKKPFPGVILNVEMVNFRISQAANTTTLVDPDHTCWAECGSLSRKFVSAIRIFFIHGKQEFTTIGFHDELPEVQRASMTSVRFGPFSDMVKKTGKWLKQQKNIRVVNMQSIDMKCVMDSNGSYKLNTDDSGHIEQAYMDAKYAKILRTFYVTTKKTEVSPYEPIFLTTRLFVPVRIAGKHFENSPKTLKRMIKWMRYTQIPPFAVETVQYQVFLGGDAPVVREDKVDTNVQRNCGRHHITTIRLYLPSEFIEPPPVISPEVATADPTRWGCSIS